jgi:hypothetical protein
METLKTAWDALVARFGVIAVSAVAGFLAGALFF